jgi:hypothetical protein
MPFPTTALPDHAEEFYTKLNYTSLVLLMESTHILNVLPMLYQCIMITSIHFMVLKGVSDVNYKFNYVDASEKHILEYFQNAH